MPSRLPSLQLLLRPQPPEHRRAEHEPGGELADDGRLTDPLHERAEPARGRNEHEQVQPEDEELVLGQRFLECGVLPSVEEGA